MQTPDWFHCKITNLVGETMLNFYQFLDTLADAQLHLEICFDRIESGYCKNHEIKILAVEQTHSRLRTQFTTARRINLRHPNLPQIQPQNSKYK